jgi:hypothetical protein
MFLLASGCRVFSSVFSPYYTQRPMLSERAPCARGSEICFRDLRENRPSREGATSSDKTRGITASLKIEVAHIIKSIHTLPIAHTSTSSWSLYNRVCFPSLRGHGVDIYILVHPFLLYFLCDSWWCFVSFHKRIWTSINFWKGQEAKTPRRQEVPGKGKHDQITDRQHNPCIPVMASKKTLSSWINWVPKSKFHIMLVRRRGAAWKEGSWHYISPKLSLRRRAISLCTAGSSNEHT